ncbi:MAG: SO_0444 family Cu/Zn efflux transporter [Desulfobacteraceae bacterium]|nr:SO_0444 family Cu/Zn efflux transporter [Desulfobacteraceae bacterium]
MSALLAVLHASWDILRESSVYIVLGLLVGGLLKVFLSPAYVADHLGTGRFSSVLKAALIGIPLPLCSCGVLPAAAAIKKQGANNGATAAFLIATPESGVDSISITYALLDPLMTIARPVAALVTAVFAGVTENLFNPPRQTAGPQPLRPCPVDGCCDGTDCSPAEHANHHSFFEKIRIGLKYAVTDLWGDLAGWFFVGLLLGGAITALVPENLITSYLGGGLASMLIMLAVGIPVYICATASTPVAAALILKGVSPGAALVFLLAGPATNMTSLAMVTGLLGRKATLRYLAVLSLVSLGCGLLLDRLYHAFGLSARAIAGHAAEIVPPPVEIAGVLILSALTLVSLQRYLRAKTAGRKSPPDSSGCGCSGGQCGGKTTAPFPRL